MAKKTNETPQEGIEIPEDATRKGVEAKTQATEKLQKNISVALERIGKNMLKNNNQIDAIHVTADGLCFYELSDAENYAASLQDNTVITVER